MPGIYGDGQPRGLRVGTDANNVAEFYSLSRTSVGLRLRNSGVESLGSFSLPAGVDSMHDYEISVTTTSVTFKVDGTVAGTFTANIPTGSLNFYAATYDGMAGNVPAAFDSVSLALTGSPVQGPPAISGFAPVRGSSRTSVTINGTNFSNAASVQFNGLEAGFSIVSDSQIVAVVPALARSGAITVTNASGTAVSTNLFTVFAAVATNDEASLDAALTNGFSEVVFTCDATINVTATKTIAADISLDAAGRAVVLSGSNAVRVFNVSPGIRLSLRNLVVANGSSATTGGGLYNDGGVVSAVDCSFTNNAVKGLANGGNASGGAIYNGANGTLCLTNCTFADNNAAGGDGAAGASGGGTGGYGGYAYGAGICNGGGSVVLVNCTFSRNYAVGGNGGMGGRGVDGYQYWHSVPWPGTGYWVTVYGGPGGRGGDGGNSFGGSLLSFSGSVSIVSCTLARGAVAGGYGGSPGSPGNYASGTYGPGSSGYSSYGGNVKVAAGVVGLKNTILAYATGSPGGNSSGTVLDHGNNLCSDNSAAFTAAGSWNNLDPLLAGEPAFNGGSTMTIPLSSLSPAINAGDAAAALVTDQRHLPRVGPCDVGAYEVQEPASLMSYAWLRSYSLATDGSADRADSDGDGVKNIDEWIAGTSPIDPASCLKMLPLVSSQPGLTIRWQSVLGKRYSLQRASELLPQGAFSMLQSNVAGQPGITTWQDTNAVGQGPYFYRVSVEP